MYQILLKTSFLAVVLLIAGCSALSGQTPSAAVPAPTATVPARASENNSQNSTEFKAQSNEGGGVTVAVQPTQVKPGAPLEFDISMNTHSVELDADMRKAVALRDDAGREIAPVAWDGPGAGGHHRAGKISFAPLAAPTKNLTLVVKDIAGVPERVFKWSLP